MTKFVHCDCEFNEHTVIVGCFLDSSGKHAFDLRQMAGVAELQAYIAARPHHVFCAYSAEAEITCLLRVGIDPKVVERMRWIDLMAECNMVSGTRPDFWSPKKSLLGYLKAFGIEPLISPDRKEAMRALILSKSEFSEEEYRGIVAYCWTDVDVLPRLLVRMRAFHEAFKARRGYDTWCVNYAEHRGHYVKACAVLAHRTKGLPINIPFFRDLERNREPVKARLAEMCNERYGYPMYVYDRAKQAYKFSMKGLEMYLRGTPFFESWKRTRTGKLRMDAEYLDEVIAAFPDLKEFGRIRNSLAQLNTNVFSLVQDGYIKGASVPFWTRTGRNQPLVKGGFILNAPPWFRHVIRPEPGFTLIAADWSRQEIGIAVALSGDAKLRAAYEGEDIYLALAEMAGAITPGMSAEQVKLTRQTYKTVQLGLGYGRGPGSLAVSIYNDIVANGGSITKEQAQADAERIYAWHKRTFVGYWSYLEREAKRARRDGFTVAVDGWVYFADEGTKHTQLLNVPMQSNGAAMLRRSMVDLAFRTDLNIVCSLHDAIYIYSREEDAEEHFGMLRDVMNRAVEATIGPDTKIKIGRTSYTHTSGYDAARDLGVKSYSPGEFVSGYHDARGRDTLREVLKLIKEVEGEREMIAAGQVASDADRGRRVLSGQVL